MEPLPKPLQDFVPIRFGPIRNKPEMYVSGSNMTLQYGVCSHPRLVVKHKELTLTYRKPRNGEDFYTKSVQVYTKHKNDFVDRYPEFRGFVIEKPKTWLQTHFPDFHAEFRLGKKGELGIMQGRLGWLGCDHQSPLIILTHKTHQLEWRKAKEHECWYNATGQIEQGRTPCNVAVIVEEPQPNFQYLVKDAGLTEEDIKTIKTLIERMRNK